MNEVQALLEKQARWQKSRQALSWPEKIRMAEAIRDSARQLRQVQSKPAVSAEAWPALPEEPGTDSDFARPPRRAPDDR